MEQVGKVLWRAPNTLGSSLQIRESVDTRVHEGRKRRVLIPFPLRFARNGFYFQHHQENVYSTHPEHHWAIISIYAMNLSPEVYSCLGALLPWAHEDESTSKISGIMNHGVELHNPYLHFPPFPHCSHAPIPPVIFWQKNSTRPTLVNDSELICPSAVMNFGFRSGHVDLFWFPHWLKEVNNYA